MGSIQCIGNQVSDPDIFFWGHISTHDVQKSTNYQGQDSPTTGRDSWKGPEEA